MKPQKISLMSLISLLLFSAIALAGDFDWMKDFNVQAKMDQNGFQARLETRFKIGDADINLVLGSVDEPADAYMLCRLGEMSQRPTAQVIEQFNANRGKGWGVLAKSLGIKPGSKDFQALKNGQDLYDNKTNKGDTKRQSKKMVRK